VINIPDLQHWSKESLVNTNANLFALINYAKLALAFIQMVRNVMFRAGSSGGARLYPATALTRLCSRSAEWNSVSPKDRDRLGLVTADDGEFW
jgi:hypothetical protein